MDLASTLFCKDSSGMNLFEQCDPVILFNSRLPAEEQERLRRSLLQIPLQEHFWISTSGTSGKPKWVALSRKAILTSAKAVNCHLQSTENDVWIHALPDFHVGGLGIWARAFLSKVKVHDYKKHEKWNPFSFHKAAKEQKATLTSLVPTQVYDLVIQNLPSPDHLRAVVVGGSALSETLYMKARLLGWNLLPSYGCTETASQIATADLSSLKNREYPALKALLHVFVKSNMTGKLCVNGDSLLTGYGIDNGRTIEFYDPKKEGWFETEDNGAVNGPCIEVYGRENTYVKIGGEGVNLNQLENTLEKLKLSLNITYKTRLQAVSDERLGAVIQLLAESQEAENLVCIFNDSVLPFERIRKIEYIQISQKY